MRNAIKCRYCGTVIESQFRHDFVTHVCEGMLRVRGENAMIGVDGGSFYLRRIGDPGDYVDLSLAPEPINGG